MDRLKKRDRPFVIPESMTRRSVLDWLGKATVLALGGELIAACTADGKLLGDSGPDGSTDVCCDGDTDSEFGEVAGAPCADGEEFGFSPGPENHPVYDHWGERTVDPQGLVSILENWELTVDGMVETPRVWSFGELIALPRQDQVTDFHCVEGWSVLDVPWNGVHLSTLYDAVGVLPSATHVTFHTIGDGYDESLPLDVTLEPRTLLAYGVDCKTLPLPHGFPIRTVVPRKWGYKNPKYVYRIELTDEPIEGYWVKLGYPYAGDVPADKLRPGKY